MQRVLSFLSILLINLVGFMDQAQAEMAVFTDRDEFLEALIPNSLIDEADQLWNDLAPEGGRLLLSGADGEPNIELVEPGSFVLSTELGGAGNRGVWLAVDGGFPGNTDQITVDGTDYSFILLQTSPTSQRNFVADFSPSGAGRYAFSMDYTIPPGIGDEDMRVLTDNGDQGTVKLSRTPGDFVGFIFDHDTLRITLEYAGDAFFISLNMDNLDFFRPNDKCPNDPDKNDPGECGCGIADVDSDGNGVLDCKEEEDDNDDDDDEQCDSTSLFPLTCK